MAVFVLCVRLCLYFSLSLSLPLPLSVPITNLKLTTTAISTHRYEGKGEDLAAAEALLDSNVEKVRSVSLWIQYLKIVSKRSGTASTKGKITHDADSRRLLEQVFERAVSNVGWATGKCVCVCVYTLLSLRITPH